MITPAYAPTATERVLPRLSLDFTTAVLDSRVTVTRALNTATRVNSSGNIATINADLPRFDYDPSTLLCKGLLIEESRTNFVTYSQDFSNAAWVYGQAAYTSGVLGPSGTTDAYKFYETATTNVHSIVQFTSPSRAAGTYTFSIYVQAAGRTQFRLMNTATTNYGVDFDLVALTATSAFGGATGTITAFRDGWYRLTMTFTSTVSIAFTFAMYLLKNGANFYAGDGSSGVNIYGTQAELGAFATSYIPTTTTSLTRNADVVSMTGANFSSWYNATEGTLVVDATTFKPASSASSAVIAEVNDGTLANRNVIQYQSNNANARTVAAGSIVSNITQVYTDGSADRVAYAFKTDSFAFARNGTLAGTDPGGANPTVDRLMIGSFSANTAPLNGYVRTLRFYGIRMINAEVTAFSKG